ncbi:MAG: M50 family metallopeptidase [Candidatus Rokubacteria bacterium]|nr:M50 family metallopeptidase [Candidatus Rokubacteria bacterium]
MKRLTDPLVIAGLWALTLAALLALFELLAVLATRREGHAFLAGAIVAFGLVARGVSFPFLGTLTHELVHAFAACLLGGRVEELWATRNRGGYVVLTVSDRLVSLAPYVVPLLALASSVLALVLRDPLHLVAVAAAGFAYAIYLDDTIAALRVDQPDLRRFWSPLLACSAVVASNSLSLLLVLFLLQFGQRAV